MKKILRKKFKFKLEQRRLQRRKKIKLEKKKKKEEYSQEERSIQYILRILNLLLIFVLLDWAEISLTWRQMLREQKEEALRHLLPRLHGISFHLRHLQLRLRLLLHHLFCTGDLLILCAPACRLAGSKCRGTAYNSGQKKTTEAAGSVRGTKKEGGTDNTDLGSQLAVFVPLS